jgi:hypothetical protein
MPNTAAPHPHTHFLPPANKEMRALFVVFGVIIVLLTVLGLLGDYKFVVLQAFRDYRRAATEGFASATGATTTTAQVVGREEPLQGAAVGDVNTEKLVASATLVPMTAQEANDAWGTMTSERCYRSDVGEPLKKTRNFLQRTNNYPRSHPDSCSAPNHEFVGTFYKPHEGVGATPATGQPMPRGALFA